MRIVTISFLCLLPVSLNLVACKSGDKEKKVEAPAPSEVPAQTKVDEEAKAQDERKKHIADLIASFKPAPEAIESETNPLSEEKIALGRMLYYDTRLSKNHDISCNTCHLLDKYGVDGRATSEGHKKQLGGRNAPTVYFAAGHIAQFWDGRAKDVEEQAKGPILNPIEMAMPNEARVLKVIKSIPGYAPAFQGAFPDDKDPITYDNLAKAIGAFERKLVTKSRWDALLQGDMTALTDAEIAGLETFMKTGCHSCHEGPLLGGSQYQKLGLIKPFPELKDKGRFEATKEKKDEFLFKVPSLRNVEKTGPYFHDGSVGELNEAIRLMAHHQRGIDLAEEDVTKIATFLATLTGPLPTDYIAMPELPKSGPKTPKPDPK